MMLALRTGFRFYNALGRCNHPLLISPSKVKAARAEFLRSGSLFLFL